MSNLKCFGWDAVRLSDCSLEHLQKLREAVELEHKNPLDAKGHPLERGQPTLYFHDKAGRKKLDAIAWAIRYKQDDERRATA